MSNPSVITLALSAASANAIALSQTPAGAVALTLNGALVAGGVATLTGGVTSNIADKARRISIASAGADTARVFTVVGTNRYGVAQGETITGVSNGGGAIGSVLDYATVTSVSVDAATAGAITVGTNNTGSTPWVLDDFLSPYWALSIAVLLQTGAATFSVEHIYDDPNKTLPSLAPTPQQWSMSASSATPPTVWTNAVINGSTASAETQYPNQPIMAHRATITAGQGTIVLYSTQAGGFNA